MARRCKSLPKPEQGYQHRDHRSKKGRTRGPDWKRHARIRRKKRLEELGLEDE